MVIRPLLRLGLALAVLASVRRLSRRSGVTDAEFFGRLPGDDVIRDPMVEWTRATTIDAPPEDVWPWLVQMGYGRGGWYTNERFDRLVWRIENKSVDDFAAYFHVLDVREEEAIVYRSIRHPSRGHPVDPDDDDAVRRLEQSLIDGGVYIDFTWVWILRRTNSGASRLMVRTRANIAPAWATVLETPLGLVDLFHVQTMFRGISRRVAATAAPTGGTPEPGAPPRNGRD
jgi:hypothetical protein